MRFTTLLTATRWKGAVLKFNKRRGRNRYMEYKMSQRDQKEINLAFIEEVLDT